MFFLIAKYVGCELDVDNVVWHFSESGHGKGAPDGVGACIKRQADAHVALGQDVSDFEKLISCLSENCKGIKIFVVDDTHIKHISEILSKSTTRAFKGTMSIRQLTWSKTDPDMMHARKLSCGVCSPDQICPHHEIGPIVLTSREDYHEKNLDLNEDSHTNSKSSLHQRCRQISPERMQDDQHFQSNSSVPRERIQDDLYSPRSSPNPVNSSSPHNTYTNSQSLRFYKMCYGSDSDDSQTSRQPLSL